MSREEYKLLTDSEYKEQWVETQLENYSEYFIEQPNLEDNYVCDCTKNYGKTCKYPEKYRDGGCKLIKTVPHNV